MSPVHVRIFSSALRELQKISFNQAPNETGGVLVGTRSWTPQKLEYNILGVLGVTEHAEFKDIYSASPTTFHCTDRIGWANLALKAVKTFGMSYIGDWHSHPNSSLNSLSGTDIRMLAQQFLLGQFNPYPPLQFLLNWQPSDSEVTSTANIMIDEVIYVVKPEVTRKEQ